MGRNGPPDGTGVRGCRGTAAPRRRFAFMTGNLPADQGRAPQLYDEQLQRQQQEKLLLQGARETRADLLQTLPPRTS